MTISPKSMTFAGGRFAGVAFGVLAVAAAYAWTSAPTTAAEGVSPLSGKIVSPAGEPLAGIPVKAHRANGTMTVAVYTDAKGEYSFPNWSDVTPGTYAVFVDLPTFEKANKDGVGIASGTTAHVDFTLKAKPLAYEDATASEIIAALPGTAPKFPSEPTLSTPPLIVVPPVNVFAPLNVNVPVPPFTSEPPTPVITPL